MGCSGSAAAIVKGQRVKSTRDENKNETKKKMGTLNHQPDEIILEKSKEIDIENNRNTLEKNSRNNIRIEPSKPTSPIGDRFSRQNQVLKEQKIHYQKIIM